MTQDQYNDLVNTVQQLTEKTDTLADSIARVDTKVENTKYVTRLLDVNVQYPAENDILVYDKTGKWKNAQYDEIGLQPGEGGESNVYVIGIGDDTSPTNENVYSAARTIEDWVSSKNDDVVEGSLTFNEGKTIYIDNIRSRNASEGTDLGNGFICKIKSSGKSYIEVDDLAVRGAAMFNTLEIKKITSIGGNLIISPASNNIIRVEETTQLYEDEYQSVYRCYFRNKDEKDGGNTEQIKTDFQAGDLAKIQQFNVAEGVNEGAINRYYWGKVLGVGEDYIDLSKTDVDSSTNTQPAEGDTLVQYGNKDNVKRQNVISLTTYADNAPAMQMYQGINDYSTDGKAIIEMAYDTAQSQQQAYMNVYGRMYVGTKDKSTSYVKYDPTENDGRGLLTVKAKLIVESDDGDVTLIEGGMIRTSLIQADQIITTDLMVSAITSGGKDLNINGNFIVKPDGSFTCNRGTINQEVIVNGNISGAKGTIGGFRISQDKLEASTDNERLLLRANQLRFTGENVTIDMVSENDGCLSIRGDSSTKLLFNVYNPYNLAARFSGSVAITCSGVLYYDSYNIYGGSTSGKFYLKPANSYILPLADSRTDYYFPTIQEFIDYTGVDNFSIFGSYIAIPIYIVSDLQYTSQRTVVLHFGEGKQLSDRPVILGPDGGTATSRDFDHQSYAMYVLYIYNENSLTSSIINPTYRGVLKEIIYRV